MTTKDLQDYQTLLTALDTAVALADSLLTCGYKLGAKERLEARRDIRLLKQFAQYTRERVAEYEREREVGE